MLSPERRDTYRVMLSSLPEEEVGIVITEIEADMARESKEWKEEASNAYAANCALGSSGMERDEIIDHLKRETKLARNFSEVYLRAYESCGEINLRLREALQSVLRYNESPDDWNADMPSPWKVAENALAMQPSHAEAIVGALNEIAKEARGVAETLEGLDDTNAAGLVFALRAKLKKLDEVLRQVDVAEA